MKERSSAKPLAARGSEGPTGMPVFPGNEEHLQVLKERREAGLRAPVSVTRVKREGRTVSHDAKTQGRKAAKIK